MKKPIPGAFSGSGGAIVTEAAITEREPAKARQEHRLAYFAMERELRSYNPRSGEDECITKAEQKIICAAELNGTLYFGDDDGSVYSYRPAARKDERLLTVDYGHGISCMSGLSGRLYFGDSNGGVHAYNPATKERKQVAEAGSSIRCMVVMGDTLYFGSADGSLRSYSPANGEKELIAQKKNGISCAAALDGTLYFGDRRGNLYSYPLAGTSGTGNHAKRKQIKNIAKTKYEIRCATVLDGILYFNAGKNVHSYDPKTEKKEETATGAGEIFCMSAFNDMLYFGDFFGYLNSCDPALREQRRVASVAGTIRCVVATSGY